MTTSIILMFINLQEWLLIHTLWGLSPIPEEESGSSSGFFEGGTE